MQIKRLDEIILKFIQNSKEKTLLEVGSHDDDLTLKLSPYFKKIYSYNEFLKIPDRTENNIIIQKKSYLEVLKQLKNFDVILMINEFHHFPDIWQMWTYDKLKKDQELLLVEWNLKGNNNFYYSSFQNCKPLCNITQEILKKFVKNKEIKIVKKISSSYKTIIKSKQEIIDHYKFELPDHWKFGEKEFLKKIVKIKYPFTLFDGFNIYKIKKL